MYTIKLLFTDYYTHCINVSLCPYLNQLTCALNLQHGLLECDAMWGCSDSICYILSFSLPHSETCVWRASEELKAVTTTGTWDVSMLTRKCLETSCQLFWNTHLFLSSSSSSSKHTSTIHFRLKLSSIIEIETDTINKPHNTEDIRFVLHCRCMAHTHFRLQHHMPAWLGKNV